MSVDAGVRRDRRARESVVGAGTSQDAETRYESGIGAPPAPAGTNLPEPRVTLGSQVNERGQFTVMAGQVQTHSVVIASYLTSESGQADADFVVPEGGDLGEYLQAAVDACAAYGAGAVLLLEGEYTVSSSVELKPSVVVRGVSRELCRVTLSCADALTGDPSGGGLSDLNFTIDGPNRFTLTSGYGFSFDRCNVYSLGVYAYDLLVSQSTITRCVFEDGLLDVDGEVGSCVFTGTLITTHGSAVVRECFLYDAPLDCVLPAIGTGPVISDNHFISTGSYVGVSTDYDVGVPGVDPPVFGIGACRIVNNTFSGFAPGMEVSVGDTTIVRGNSFQPEVPCPFMVHPTSNTKFSPGGFYGHDGSANLNVAYLRFSCDDLFCGRYVFVRMRLYSSVGAGTTVFAASGDTSVTKSVTAGNYAEWVVRVEVPGSAALHDMFAVTFSVDPTTANAGTVSGILFGSVVASPDEDAFVYDASITPSAAW